jgi:HpcH/HpaI aldolase/citrate lyase family
VLGAPLELILFSHDLDYAEAAMAAGMNSVVVDWEWADKSVRQFGFDTEINRGTETDLLRMRERVQGNLICRINNGADQRVREALRAADLGANEIWLPMVRSVAEVEQCLKALDGRCVLSILCETAEAVALAKEWAQLPLSRVYIGLNDLQIDLGNASLFSAMRRHHRRL